jgi:uncharacterized protein (UPF0332 family)
MQRSIRPDWLLRQADDLAGRNAGSGSPRNADLRRAVSSAYYALFHHVTLLLAQALLPTGSEKERLELTRLFNHTDLAGLCERVTGTGTPPKHQGSVLDHLRANVILTDIATAFSDLMQARHDADYNHLAQFSRPEVLTLIDSANDAVQKLDSLQGGPDFQRFAALAAVYTRLR